jgi:hypothetical protein
MSRDETSKDAERCERCQFSMESGGSVTCRRYPPMMDQSRAREAHFSFNAWQFPIMREWDWCGEFKARVTAP